ncbi:hypothetical protein [Streptomyces sp. NPDC002889]|uniref:hypothetical protein n=1 Tax=Streptomyces sp. NPDC002889 TaxID=3364669 RepID=UPI0036C74809
MIDYLKREARTVHRQPQPLWLHKVNGTRVNLLGKPVPTALGLTQEDLITGGSRPEDNVLRGEFNDPRLAALLRTLDDTAVLAWAYPGIATPSRATRTTTSST